MRTFSKHFIVYSIFALILWSFSPVIKWGLEQSIAKDMKYLVSFYEELHQNPEISLKESKTAARLASELDQLGFEVAEGVGGHGIVGILKNGDGPVILYRTDLDALPMSEKTGLSYASTKQVVYNGLKVGAMHSCGHDVHMTTWLGTARQMVALRDQWSGTLMFIGQPAEEIGAGARMMFDAGLYERFGVPDYGIALHSSPVIPAGQIGIASGYTMANAEYVDIKVPGVGSHGASPHMSIDPVVVASMIVMDLQTIVSRNVKPIDDAVVTVGAIHGGTKHNIISDEVTLQLTIRTFKEDVRLLIQRRINEIVAGAALAAGLPDDLVPEVIYKPDHTPSNYNEPALVAKIKACAAEAIGESNVLYAEPQMLAEDFSRFGRTKDQVPCALFWLGTVSEENWDKGFKPGLHSPYYAPDAQGSIETGVNMMSTVLLNMLSQEKQE
ncbi:MAG: amidohydrolase [Reichenbachiella sp.]|uniref:M20 metallopeptidase family protein n=1 Tax=Reichenbachiella sp. TaxID=2184521 RepID=UPI003297B2D6